MKTNDANMNESVSRLSQRSIGLLWSMTSIDATSLSLLSLLTHCCIVGRRLSEMISACEVSHCASRGCDLDQRRCCERERTEAQQREGEARHVAGEAMNCVGRDFCVVVQPIQSIADSEHHFSPTQPIDHIASASFFSCSFTQASKQAARRIEIESETCCSIVRPLIALIRSHTMAAATHDVVKALASVRSSIQTAAKRHNLQRVPRLVAVSKTKPVSMIKQCYDAGSVEGMRQENGSQVLTSDRSATNQLESSTMLTLRCCSFAPVASRTHTSICTVNVCSAKTTRKS